MAKEEDVDIFLRDFKAKLNVWGVAFSDDRGKNAEALLELEISPIDRIDILKEIEVLDYSQGPVPNMIAGLADLWIFGKIVKGKEVYIKVSLGLGNNKTICVSFHVAEYEMKYPFKK